ncbi:FAST kinase domain-containing protein 4-like, partial [Crotalus tigris]|uniref:FAST kinase domain-containing protein 4-like n=1 Tax=Crotalus tigris TaxID=88082 RepID=UPI00192F83E7
HGGSEGENGGKEGRKRDSPRKAICKGSSGKDVRPARSRVRIHGKSEERDAQAGPGLKTPPPSIHSPPPAFLHPLFQSHHILDGQLSSLNPSLLVDLVWSLCVLQQAEAVHFQSVLVPRFYSGFFGNWTPARQNAWLKLMHINTTAQLESPGYAGPFLPSDKLSLQDLGVTRTPTSLQTDVNAVLTKLAGEEAKLRFNVDTPYGWKLDAEMVLDSENNPLPVAELEASSVGQPSVEAGGRRLAFLLWEFPNFSSRSKDLLGRFVMARRHIQTAGYVVVEVPYHEWFNLNTDWKKTQYLKDKIQKSVARDLAE